jgi:hypothetical protein
MIFGGSVANARFFQAQFARYLEIRPRYPFYRIDPNMLSVWDADEIAPSPPFSDRTKSTPVPKLHWMPSGH